MKNIVFFTLLISLFCSCGTPDLPPDKPEPPAVIPDGPDSGKEEPEPSKPLPVPGELKADASKDVYKLITDRGYQCGETPDLCGVHTAFGKHITQSYDFFLKEDVFDFHIHINEDNDRGMATITDRQRNEIKTDANSPRYMLAYDGESLRMSWKFRLPSGLKTTNNFCHVHQLKGLGNGANVSAPLITFTCRTTSKGAQVFQIIARTETSSNEYLCNDIPLSEFLGEWVEVVETAKFATQGSFSVLIKRLSDGKTLLELKNVPRDFSRSGNPGYRPKWGVYRSFGEGGSLKSQMRDETFQFADFKIEKL